MIKLKTGDTLTKAQARKFKQILIDLNGKKKIIKKRKRKLLPKKKRDRLNKIAGKFL